MIAKTIRTCFPIAAAAVSDKAEEINKLNVFPVPDGDTGTNMSLTLASVTKELSALPADADMEAIAGAITHGSLMGARGNSGVITSQILRGVAEGLVSVDEPITSANIAFAFRRAVKVAFQAVRKPIEARSSRCFAMSRPRPMSAKRRSSRPRTRSTPSSSRPTSPSPARPTCCPF